MSESPYTHPKNGTIQLDAAVKPTSPAWAFLQMVWVNSPRSSSWERTRLCIGAAARIAIQAGFTWDAYTLAYLSQACSRWNGCHGNAFWHAGEDDYAYACSFRGGPNKTFVAAYEQWRGRKPFILKERNQWHGTVASTRLHVGRRFEWEGTRVKCTSFAEDGSYLVATAYQDGGESKVRSVLKITLPMLRAHNSALAPAKREAA